MDSTQLGVLRNKLSKEVREQEEVLKKLRDKIMAIDLVLGMLIEQTDTNTGMKPAEANNTRFRKMGLTEAILACMGEPVRWWSPPEIKRTLLAGGLKSKSKDPYNSITSTLQRLLKKGMVVVEKQEKGKRYKIKEGETSTVNAMTSQPESSPDKG